MFGCIPLERYIDTYLQIWKNGRSYKCINILRTFSQTLKNSKSPFNFRDSHTFPESHNGQKYQQNGTDYYRTGDICANEINGQVILKAVTKQGEFVDKESQNDQIARNCKCRGKYNKFNPKFKTPEYFKPNVRPLIIFVPMERTFSK